MGHRVLEINVISAKDLKNVNILSKMEPYAVVFISGDGYRRHTAAEEHKTAVARDSGTNPTWNHPMKFVIDESAATQNRLFLVFRLRTRRALSADRDIGEVNVPVKELLDGGVGKGNQFVSYQVRSPSGKPRGVLNFSYNFGETVTTPPPPPMQAAPPQPHKAADEPVLAYPAHGVEPSSGYGAYPAQPVYPPPMAPQSVYPPPMAAPQPGYGYPPPQAPGYGYGYPGVVRPQQQQGQKKNRFGMGLGAGLLGGALGGMILGDMVSDASDYDSGFGGFDDGFGDDFGF